MLNKASHCSHQIILWTLQYGSLTPWIAKPLIIFVTSKLHHYNLQTSTHQTSWQFSSYFPTKQIMEVFPGSPSMCFNTQETETSEHKVSLPAVEGYVYPLLEGHSQSWSFHEPKHWGLKKTASLCFVGNYDNKIAICGYIGSPLWDSGMLQLALTDPLPSSRQALSTSLYFHFWLC